MPTHEKPEPSPSPETPGPEPAVLLEDEWSSTPAVPIAPHLAQDFIRRPPIFDLANHVNVIWESSRVDDVNQIFATRWNAADPDTTLPTNTVPQQVTIGPAAHKTPAAVMLPGGDLLVAYETAQDDIYFKRAPFERLTAATEHPVATSQRDREKFPFVLRSGTRLVFFWISADRDDPHPRWRARVRNYTSAWTEVEAT